MGVCFTINSDSWSPKQLFIFFLLSILLSWCSFSDFVENDLLVRIAKYSMLSYVAITRTTVQSLQLYTVLCEYDIGPASFFLDFSEKVNKKY